MARLIRHLKTAIGKSVDFLWPPACLACGTSTPDAATLCPTCWDACTLLSDPQCARCGFPFEIDHGPDTICGACAAATPPFDRARAALVYDTVSRGMILRFKHADRIDLANGLVRLMRPQVAPLLEDTDIVAPVPLHWSRLLRRRYNQAALLSSALAKLGRARHVPDLVTRSKRTPSQGGKSGAARRRNMQGAFSVPQRHRAVLRDRRVLLVDDVMTTGATVSAVTRALLRAGAGAVDVITIARVTGEGL